MYIKHWDNQFERDLLDFWLEQGTLLGVFVTWTVSGSFLIWAIYAIRRFLKQRAQINHPNLNIKQLLLHSVAFGLFLVSVVVFEFFNLAYSTIDHYQDMKNKPTKASFFNIWVGLEINLIYCSLLSQILLCSIFWHLSNKPDNNDEPLTDTTQSSIVTVTVQDFDDDAELQARIWNAFTREQHGIEDTEEGSFAHQSSQVTVEQIILANIATLSQRKQPTEVTESIEESNKEDQ